MIHINKYIYKDICNKDYNVYLEFMSCIRTEYMNCLNNIKKSTTISEIRFLTHKLVSIISNLINNELMYTCKLLLMIDKNHPNITIDNYKPYIDIILNYDKTILGL